MNLYHTPFSVFGAYIGITAPTEDKEVPYLSLKSLHSKSKSHLESMTLFSFDTVTQKPLPFHYDACYSHIKMISPISNVSITFDGEKRIIIDGSGSGLQLDTKPLFNFEYNYLLGNKNQPYCIVNSCKNHTKYLIYTSSGQIKLHQELLYDVTGRASKSQNTSLLTVLPDEDGRFTCIIEDMPTHGIVPLEITPSYQEAEDRTRKTFDSFWDKCPLVSNQYKKTLQEAAYVLWSSTVHPHGYLGQYTIYASNKDFPASFSWDHAFNALGLVHIDQDLAWKQMTAILDHQDEWGQVPDFVGDTSMEWNFSKPPVQGLFFRKMMSHMDFTREQKEYVIEKVEKQILYFLKYKDSNQDGIPEYHHGNDSGHDNSSVFHELVPVDSPDLTAFLIEAMVTIIQLSRELGEDEKARFWEEKFDFFLNKFLSYFLVDGLPVARKTMTGDVINSEAILPYISIILGDKLPKETVKSICELILSSKYLTKWGIASEAIDSPKYIDDAYWRGPIWAPSTLLIVEALEECGYIPEAMSICERFCEMVKTHGFAENFNALTGEGLRDKSFTWTASTFIHLAAKLYVYGQQDD